MTSKIKPRYDSLDLLPLGHSRFLAISAAAKKKDAQYCMEIIKDAMDDLRENDSGLVEEAFESREQAVDAICRAVQYEGPNDSAKRADHIRTCLTIGWAIGVREEVSGFAIPGMSELHHLNALNFSWAMNSFDEHDSQAIEFAYNAGYYLARTGDQGIGEIVLLLGVGS